MSLDVAFSTTIVASLVALLLVRLSVRLLLILVRMTKASTVFGLMTHLEASLTVTLVTLATVVSVAVVTLWEVPSIYTLPVTA